ncbi:MAG: methyltransferase domain-containing protein [Bacteroidia bacterium]
MEITDRKPLQGVANIVRFNWHFYIIALVSICAMLYLAGFVAQSYTYILYGICIAIILSMLTSLAVSFYVYDVSNLYSLYWFDAIAVPNNATIVNINAGFDETSALLQHKYPKCTLAVLDFYNPATHTEVSIKRARSAYPPYPNTQQISTNYLPLNANSVDVIAVTFAAHEIRNNDERMAFFNELKRIIKPTGKIIITEHLRDWPNFTAYNIGYFHFLSKQTWQSNIATAQLTLFKEIKITPFISSFILHK